MSCAIGFGAYRVELVDHPVPVRVIGPDGRQRRELSRASSWIWDRCDRKRARRWISAALSCINVVHDAMPASGPDRYDVGNDFISSVARCREIQDEFFVVRKVPTDDARENDDSYWIKPKKADHAKMSDAIIAMGLVTRALTIAEIFDRDPSKVDPALSRTKTTGAVLKQTRTGLRSDTDRRIRLGGVGDHAPRYDDPRFYDHLKIGLETTGASTCVRLSCGLAWGGGGRAVSILSLTLYDILVGAERPGRYWSRNKGDKGDARSFKMIVPLSEHRRVMDYIEGERSRLSGYSLAKLQLMAADPRRRGLLKQMPLLILEDARPLTYKRLWKELRRAAIAMDLFIDDAEYRRTGIKRYVTFHYLRHEYVHRRMDRMRKLPEAAQEAEKKDIIAYMRWSGPAMLAWYSAHYEIKHADVAADLFASEQQGDSIGWTGVDLPEADFELDEVLEAFG